LSKKFGSVATRPSTQSAMMAMICQRGKWSMRLFGLSFGGLARVSVNCLTGSPLARTSDIIWRTTRTRTPSAISSWISRSSMIFEILPTSPPEVTTVSPRLQRGDHFLVLLHALLLRPQDQEIEHHEDEDKRQERNQEISASGSPSLCVSGRDEHLVLLVCPLAVGCARVAPRRSARTILTGRHFANRARRPPRAWPRPLTAPPAPIGSARPPPATSSPARAAPGQGNQSRGSTRV
jgi:hypothetical protein